MKPKKKQGETRGRKTILNEELQNEIVALLNEGVDQKTACNLAGVAYSTYNEWKAKGEAGQEPYASFFSVISRARDKHQLRLLKIINDAAEGMLPRHADWKAAAWQLERGWPKKYAPYDRRPLPSEGADGKPKPISVAIIHNGKPIEELCDFPVRGDLSPRPPENGNDKPEMDYNRFTQRFEPLEPVEPIPK